MSQNTFLNAILKMIKTFSRRKPFLLLALFIIVMILTAIINSNNEANTVMNSNNFKYRPKHQFEEDRNDEFSKIKPQLHSKNDGNEDSIRNLKNNLDYNPQHHKKKGGKMKNSIGYIPERRFVHLDLKGAAPKVFYIKEVFKLIEKAGANGVMIEWEDMFPFEGDLAIGKHEFAYSKKDVQDILQAAELSNLEVIPLIQSFGHLEYFLKFEKYRPLREIDKFPQAICPSKDESFKLVTKIIDQVMAIHKNAKFIHIGCDEVFQLGSCDKCRQAIHDKLFLDHVTKVADYVHTKYRIGSIMWDDMLRQFSETIFQQYDFEKIGLEVMVWTYIDDIYRFIPQETWSMYGQYFPKIWGASAFKGAFGETLMLPNVKMHLDNNIAWLNAMKEMSEKIKFQGLVITGWQRYDHLGNLCELLPSGIPSLIVDLMTINQGYYNPKLMFEIDDVLQCNSPFGDNSMIDVKNDQFLQSKRSCSFPGSRIFQLAHQTKDLIKRVDDYLYDVTTHKAWLGEFNEIHNISNPMRIQEALQNYDYLYQELQSVLKEMYKELCVIFEEYTALEWIEQKIYPSIKRMEQFHNRTQKLDQLRVWPRRPIKTIKDLKRFLPNKDNMKNSISGDEKERI